MIPWEQIKSKQWHTCNSCNKEFPCAELRQNNSRIFLCRKCYRKEVYSGI